MTLISNDLDFEVKRSIHDKNGRFLILDAIINEKEIMLVNLYAPNEQINQIIFFKLIQQMLREFSGQKIIIAGDFNCPLSPLDKRGGRPVSERKQVIDEIQKIMVLYSLSDIWREKHPLAQEFTWRDKAIKIQCRLDLFLISNDFKDIVPSCEIKHTTVSDHSSVNLQIESQDQKHKRGQGFWKFINSLLKDEEFVNELRSAIPGIKKEYNYLDDKGLKWDLIKMFIRALTIKYSKRKARNNRNREISLFQELNGIQKNLESNPNNSSLKLKLHNIKQELDKIADENTRSSILRK